MPTPRTLDWRRDLNIFGAEGYRDIIHQDGYFFTNDGRLVPTDPQVCKTMKLWIPDEVKPYLFGDHYASSLGYETLDEVPDDFLDEIPDDWLEDEGPSIPAFIAGMRQVPQNEGPVRTLRAMGRGVNIQTAFPDFPAHMLK